MRGWPVIVVGLMFQWGCGFDARSSDYACETHSDCETGRSCELGWCVIAHDATLFPDAPQGPDASVVDAAAPDASTGRPLSSCSTCAGGECREECNSNGCTFECAVTDCDCEFQCSPTTKNCELACKENTTCHLDCAGAEACKPDCQVNSICDIDCTGVLACEQSKCEAGAQCLLDCTNTAMGTCLFEVCAGTETSCPNDIIACNRACP